MATGTQEIVTDNIALFVTSALVVLGAVAGVALGILIYKWGMKRLRGAAR